MMQMPMGAMPMQPPQPPTKEQMSLLDKPSWEEVMRLLRDKVHRGYRIDIETDSTIAGSLESDMEGLSQVLQGIGAFMREASPLVQSGALPLDAAKEIMMTITRRARMGMAVEDALDKMQPPKPPPDPALQVAQAKAQAEAQKSQMEAQLEQQKMQVQAQMDERERQQNLQIEQQRMMMEAEFEKQRQQNEMAVEQHKQEVQARQIEHQNQLEAQRAMMQSENETRLEQFKIAHDERMKSAEQQLQLILAQMNNATKIEVAEIGKLGGLLDEQQTAAAERAADDAGVD
jgi:flagellar biosynthesis GTPase FlhF